MNKTFLIGDTHFGHENIIKYENRPFKDTSAMDKMLIQNWNNVVSKTDKVFILGDFALGTKSEIKDIASKLNGNKILIMGNHDLKNIQFWYDTGFKEVYKYPIVYKDFAILSHEPPTYFNDNTPYYHFYAHVHSTDMYKTITKNTACLSVERWNYTPVNIDKLLDLMKLV